MFNEISIDSKESEKLSSLNKVISAQEIFPGDVLAQLERLRSGEIDNLIIHGLPIVGNLIETPQEIRKSPENILPIYLLRSLGSFLGTISSKGIENTIRFRTGNQGIVNEETWHRHREFKYSIFYCLRADPNAKTYLFSFNSLISNAEIGVKQSLLTPFSFVPSKSPFPLVAKGADVYELSYEVYAHSDFEKYVKDLDLPDVIKALEKISTYVIEPEAQKTVNYLNNAIKNSQTYIVYKPGDIAIYDERSTMRFSPSFFPTTSPQEDRWLLALSVV